MEQKGHDVTVFWGSYHDHPHVPQFKYPSDKSESPSQLMKDNRRRRPMTNLIADQPI